MKKFELFTGLISLFCLIMYLLQVPWFGMISGIIFTILSLFYYIFGFALFNNIKLSEIFQKKAYSYTSTKKIIGAIALGYAISALIIGCLLKLELIVKGSTYLLLFGLLLIATITIISLFFYRRKREDFYRRIFKRTVIYGVIGLILFLTPINLLVDIYYGDRPEYAELYKKVLDDPDNIELEEQLKQMQKEIFLEEMQHKSE